MKILIVEDNEFRLAKFKTNLADAELTTTDDPQTAIKLLSENKYDYLLLDHDLGGEASELTLPDRGSGYDVAKWLSENEENNKQMSIIIHSLNPAGADRMFDLLSKDRDCRRIPYAWDRLHYIV